MAPSAKSRQKRRDVLFAAKGIFSAGLAAIAIAGIAYRVAMLHQQAMVPEIQFDPSKCQFDTLTSNYGRLEPSTASPYLGFVIDWATDNPTKLTSRLGRRPAVVGSWIKLYPTTFEGDMLNWMAQELSKQAKAMGGAPSLLHATVVPEVSLDQIQNSTWIDLAKMLRYINFQYGVPVLLRLAHEMNGNWNVYGQKPYDYIRAWKTFVPILRQETNLTATLWAPNMGENYPYVSTPIQVQKGNLNSEMLDTNKDGIVDIRDDPYTPYYPGDQYVDWVGISVYWFGQQYPTSANFVPPADRFVNVVRGVYPNAPIQYNFYQMFAANRNKPMAIPESGAVFYEAPVAPGPGELNIKRTWWRQVFNAGVFAQFPMIKLYSHFDEDKVEERGSTSYAITLDPAIRQPFLADLPYEAMIWGDQYSYSCDGKIYRS